ncbi:phage tail protein [Paracoccus yeei]|uniref:Phage tail protein n=1 Tax=Paracoccus yeei TaxID=147645 RepID=A0A386UIT3_9RHOB|nr:tail protein X [Paracoccus yeei]AYF00471.1 phage tail protein [Paracoccus yeei]AZV00477.1 tail protein X [Paracoccus phage vB_PyeM_Pyei1]
MTTVSSIAGETVDLICRRHYGDESGYVEAVYDANRGLAALGAILPAGVVIVLPEVVTAAQADAVVRLWD